MLQPGGWGELLVAVLLVVGLVLAFMLVLFLLGVIRVPASVHDVYYFTHCEPARLPTGIMGWRCQ